MDNNSHTSYYVPSVHVSRTNHRRWKHCFMIIIIGVYPIWRSIVFLSIIRNNPYSLTLIDDVILLRKYHEIGFFMPGVLLTPTIMLSLMYNLIAWYTPSEKNILRAHLWFKLFIYGIILSVFMIMGLTWWALGG